MSNYNPDNPILFLTGEVDSTAIISRYEHDDETGLGPSGTNIPMVTEITVSGILAQSIGSNAGRASGQYDAFDIKTGDWVSDADGKKCLEIISISDVNGDAGTITFRAKDIDAYSYKNFTSNTFSGGDTICFFEISDNGTALITGDTLFFTDNKAIDKIQTRFAVAMETERYRMEFSSDQTAVSKGDVVTIDGSGNLIPFGAVGSQSYKIGILSDKSYGGRIAYIKPFNTIIDNYKAPERLTGSAGDIYYNSTANPGEIVTDPAQGNDRVFFQIKDAIPTVVESTLAGNEMVEGDSLILNNDEIFAALGVGVSKTPEEIKDEINLSTNVHHVVASVTVPSTVVESDGNTTANGDVVFVLDSGGGPSAPSVTIGDGTNSASVTFSTADEDGAVFGQPSWDTISAFQIADDLNTAFTANSVDIVASTFSDITNTNNPSIFPGLRLTAGVGKSIVITNGSADVFGQSFIEPTSAMGIADSDGGSDGTVTVDPSTDEFLKLTRADGGDIMVQGEGSFVNRNGIVSSSSGSPALLLMIEDEEGSGSTAVGAETADDLNQTPNVTTADGDDSGIVITHTPFSDSNVQILVNGINVNLGDGAKNEACYFSVDGGTTARAIADIEGGDSLYWNGSIVGYELDGSDEIDVIYDKEV
jgi:hypothetical protein